MFLSMLRFILLLINRYMKTSEQLSALCSAKQTLHLRDQKLARMKSRLESITSVKGVEIDPESSQQIEAAIAKVKSEMESLLTTDFKIVFWDQQVIVYASF